MTKQLSLILAGIVLFITGCSAEPLHVALKLQPGTEKEWASLISHFPLPGNIIVEKGTQTGNKYSIELKSSFSRIQNTLPVQSSKNFTIYSSIISREWYAPEAELWNPNGDGKADKKALHHLVPLNQIHLPMKALSINGIYPDNAEYPEVKTTTLSLSQPAGSTEEQLVAWIKEISRYSADSINTKPEIIWIAGVGDLMVQRGVENILMDLKNGLTTIFTNTLPVLKRQDLLLGNLEGSITRRTVKTPKSYNFKFNPEVLPFLHQAGFDYLSQTNNHIYDYGRAGFIDSLTYLKKSSIATSGAGLTVKEAQKYWETTIKGLTIRVLSIGAFPRENNGFDGKTQASVTPSRPGILFAGPTADAAVKNMVSKDTFDIIFIHGGREWHSRPVKYQEELYRKYIDMGADLILGSHPHVLQGLEARKSKLIAYSLGNFIFPGMGGMRYGEDSMILSLGIVHGIIKYVVPIPVVIHNRTIALAKNNRSLTRYMKLTEELNN